jgi:hypothetical protein
LADVCRRHSAQVNFSLASAHRFINIYTHTQNNIFAVCHLPLVRGLQSVSRWSDIDQSDYVDSEAEFDDADQLSPSGDEAYFTVEPLATADDVINEIESMLEVWNITNLKLMLCNTPHRLEFRITLFERRK